MHYVTEASFSKSEATRFMELPPEIRDRLSGNGAVCFLSKSGNQIEFVYAAADIDGTGERFALLSAKCRLSRGGWNPLMLQNYANQVGLRLENIKSFEKYFNRDV